MSKRPLTAMKTTDARMALGIGRKAPVSSSSTRATKRAVKTPCIGVQFLPQVAATMADRESEPATGYDWKKAPMILAHPRASSS